MLLLPSPAPYSTITLPSPRYPPRLHHPVLALSSHPLSPKGADTFLGAKNPQVGGKVVGEGTLREVRHRHTVSGASTTFAVATNGANIY